VWYRIEQHVGEVFETKRASEFTYWLDQGGFFPTGRNHRIDISDFKNAYRNVPCEGPTAISRGIREVRGSSYIWAVLHDRRIRRQD
jgi:hypothetical protein